MTNTNGRCNDDKSHRNGHPSNGVCMVFNLPLKKNLNDEKIGDKDVGSRNNNILDAHTSIYSLA